MTRQVQEAWVAAPGVSENPVNHELLLKLMLAQCISVGLAALPHIYGSIVGSLPTSWLPAARTSPKPYLYSRDLGYVLQVSLNVFLYSSVSTHFKKEVIAMFSCKTGTHVQAIGQADQQV